MANLYQWTGINKQGQHTKGNLEAQDMKEAQSELAKMGIEVITLKQSTKFSFSFGRKKVKNKNILLFTRYLSTMMAAGLPILQALDVIAQDQENEKMHSFVIALRTNIASGKSLAESFKQYPEYFNSLYTNLIKAGERSGTLDKILKRLGIYLERTETLKAKVKKALMYPAAIIVVSMIVSTVLLLFVVPKFKGLFDSFGAKLPVFTRMVLSLSDFVQSWWWIILIVLGIMIWGFRYALKNVESVRYKADEWILRIFVLGPILRKSIIARFARTLATTLDAGMPIAEALRSMAPIMGNVIYSDAMLKICDDVVSGHQLNVAMSNTKIFPNMVVQMVSVGEVSGSLAEMLNKVADYYEEDVNNSVDNLSSLLEPAIMLVLGVIIGSLIIAMYLPIFKLGSLF